MNKPSDWNQVLEMVKNDDTGKWDTTKTTKDLAMDKRGILSVLNEVGPDRELTLTDRAFGQMCGRYHMPVKYVKSLPANVYHNLFNHHLDGDPSRRKFFLRCRGDFLRAFLTERYAPLNNGEMVDILSGMTQKFGHEIRQFHLDDDGLWCKILIPDLTRPDPSKAGAFLKVGILIGNSEVGSRSISVEPFVYRQTCTNDLVVQEAEAMKARHVGGLLSRELSWRMTESMGKALKSGNELMDRMAQAYDDRIEKPEDIIKAIAEKRNLTQKITKEVQMSYAVEPDKNRFGLMNAFTRAAQRFTGDQRIELERLGGSLLTAIL